MYKGITTRWRPKVVDTRSWYRKGVRRGWLMAIITLGLVILGVVFHDIKTTMPNVPPTEVAR